jgi:hypothetical protein
MQGRCISEKKKKERLLDVCLSNVMEDLFSREPKVTACIPQGVCLDG